MNPELKTNEEDKTIEKPISNNIPEQTVNSGMPSDMANSLEVEQHQVDMKPEPQMPSNKPVKKGIIKKVLIIALIILLILGGSLAAFLWRDMTAKDFESKQAATITSLKKSIASLTMELNVAKDMTVGGQTSCTPVAPVAATIDNIKSSIASGNIATLEGYMANTVNVILTDTGSTTFNTSARAVTSVNSFIASATLPWNFALSQSVLSKYSTGKFGNYFTSVAVVGLSANNQVISFGFDCQGKISTVLLSPNTDLLK